MRWGRVGGKGNGGKENKVEGEGGGSPINRLSTKMSGCSNGAESLIAHVRVNQPRPQQSTGE